MATDSAVLEPQDRAGGPATDRFETGDGRKDFFVEHDGVAYAGTHLIVDLYGASGIDESLLTGESMPTTKTGGDDVIGGSLNTESPLIITVTIVAVDSHRQTQAQFRGQLTTLAYIKQHGLDSILNQIAQGSHAIVQNRSLIEALQAYEQIGNMSISTFAGRSASSPEGGR